jgi:TadE-like protein
MNVGCRKRCTNERRKLSAYATLRRSEQGAVFVEFLIAFLPVFIFFLCLVQLGLLFTVRLVTEHAALNAARAAAVVIGDEPQRYGNEPINQLRDGGKRYAAIRDSALISLSPLILDGTVDGFKVVFPATPGGAARTGNSSYAAMSYSSVSQVRVRIEVTAICKIAIANRIACSSFASSVREALSLQPTRLVKAEAIFPYQGARYDFPP